MTEEWKDIEGYEGRYQVSNLGAGGVGTNGFNGLNGFEGDHLAALF